MTVAFSRGYAFTCRLGSFLRMTLEPQWPSWLGWGLESGSAGDRGAFVWVPGVHRGWSGEQPLSGRNEDSLLEPEDQEQAPNFVHF